MPASYALVQRRGALAGTLRARGVDLADAGRVVNKALRPPRYGTGYIAGESPDGVTTLENVPVAGAEVRVYYEDEDKNLIFVNSDVSAASGTYRVDNLPGGGMTANVIGVLAGHGRTIKSDIAPLDLPRVQPDTVKAYVGVPLDYPIATVGGKAPRSVAWKSGSYPSGVSFASGALTGSHPTGSTGNYPVVFTVTDADSVSHDSTLTIELILLPITLTATPAVPAFLTFAEPMDPVTFSASGGEGPYTFSVSAGGLPTGTSLDSNTGVWDGTPAAGDYNFSVTASGVRGTPDTKSYSVSVTANYATLNPADMGSHIVLSDGNLLASSTSNGEIVRSTAEIVGKVYFEAKFIVAYTGTGVLAAGVANLSQGLTESFYKTANGWALWGTGAGARHNSTLTFAKTIADGDTVGFAVDALNHKMWISVNGTWLTGDPAAGTSPMWSDLNGQLYGAAAPRYGGNNIRMHFDPAEFDYPAPSGFGPLTE